ncbi:MAG: hypothetical protein RIT04_228 [Candidatus Parcubacteria bacterium]|jgi:hypothetical protein
MITQELIDYVKIQLSAGVAREKISSDLLGQGWTIEQTNEVFHSVEQSTGDANVLNEVSSANKQTKNLWETNLPKNNTGSLRFAIGFFLIVDTTILVLTQFSLFMFWAEMLAVIAIMWAFVHYENKVLSPRYMSSTSKLDKWISALIALRNIVFFLNLIPGIQILGFMLLVWGGIPYLLIYFLIIHARNKSAVAI